MGEPLKQKLKIRNIISVTALSLIQKQNLDLSDCLLTVYSNSKDLQMFILQHTKNKVIKKHILVTNFFTG